MYPVLLYSVPINDTTHHRRKKKEREAKALGSNAIRTRSDLGSLRASCQPANFRMSPPAQHVLACQSVTRLIAPWLGRLSQGARSRPSPVSSARPAAVECQCRTDPEPRWMQTGQPLVISTSSSGGRLVLLDTPSLRPRTPYYTVCTYIHTYVCTPLMRHRRLHSSRGPMPEGLGAAKTQIAHAFSRPPIDRKNKQTKPGPPPSATRSTRYIKEG